MNTDEIYSSQWEMAPKHTPTTSNAAQHRQQLARQKRPIKSSDASAGKRNGKSSWTVEKFDPVTGRQRLVSDARLKEKRPRRQRVDRNFDIITNRGYE
jgi:hypothetical protein